MAKTLALIVGSFNLRWGPLTILNLVSSYKKDLHFFEDQKSRIWAMLAAATIHLSSAIDPIIYAYRIKEVRVTFENILRSLKCIK